MSKPVIILDAGQLVGLSGTTDGDVLTWNGTEWVSSPGGGVGTVTSVALSTASTGLTVSGGTTQTITGSGTFTLGGTLGAGYGGTGLGAPVSGDAGKVLTATAGGEYELTTPAAGSVTDVTASAPLASSGGATPDISLTGTVSPTNGGTGLGAPVVGDAGKVLTATAGGGYELTTNGAGTVTSITAGDGLDGGTITDAGTISMPNVGTADTYGSASSVPVFTTDAQGRVSAVTNTSIGISTAQVTGLDTALGTFALKTTTISAGTGLSGGGDLSANRTISMPSVGSAGTYGSASSVAVVTTDAQGRVSGATTTSIAVTQSQVSGLTTALAAKADKTVQLLSGAGIDITGGTLAGNSTISLKSEFAGQADQGSATKTVTLTTDSYGRVTSIAQQNIAGLAASVITSGQLGIANGGTGLDASSVLAGAVLMGEVGGGSLALHKLSGDATMLGSGALTVTGLQKNSVSATVLGEPDAGKALVWSGSEWQATNIQGGGGGGGLTFYMNYAASSPFPMSTQFDEHAGWDTGAISVANDANGTQMGTFVTAVGAPAIEVIPAGIWDVNFYAQASNNANTTAVRIKVATLAGATQTVIATSDWVYISDPSAVNGYTATVYVPTTDVSLTDRVEIIFEGRRYGASARTITLHFGNDSITHVHTTINAPGGTGLLKVVDGYLQSPASLLVNADVDSAAAIAVAKLASGTNSYVLTTVAGVPTWQAPAATGVTTLTGTSNQVLVNGGFGTPVSGAVTLTLPQAIDTNAGPTFGTLKLSTLANGILKATGGTGSIQSGFVDLATSEVGGKLPINKGGTNLTSSGASGNLLVSDGSAWASVAMAGDASILASGTITLANTGSAGTYGSASAVPVFVTDVKGRVTSVTNTSIAIGTGAITSGTLNTTRGGTGVSNPSTGTLLLGAGAGAMTSLSGTAGDTIIWSGSTWTASALSSNAVTSLAAGTGVSVSASTGAVTVSIGQAVGTSDSPSFAGLTLTATPLAVGSGGTGAATLTGYVKGSGTSAMTASATIPTSDLSGSIALGSQVSGTLPVANGGTGVSSLTSNALLVGGSTVGGLSGSASGQFARWNNASGAWAATALTGTTNQITVTSDATSTTLSIPYTIQPTATASSTTFSVKAGDVTGSDAAGSNLALLAGAATGSGLGGNLTITAGLSPSFTGGTVTVKAGSGSTNGDVSIGETQTANIYIGASGITTRAYGTLRLPNVTTGTIASLLAADSSGNIIKTSGATLPLTNGGTNASLTATAGGAVYGTGTALGVTAAGTNGQFLKSNGASAPTWADVTATAPYDILGRFAGNPASSAVLYSSPVPRSVTVSTTTGNHYFYASALPSAGTSVLTVYKTLASNGTKSALFTATWTAGQAAASNGLYQAVIGTVSNNTLAAGDVLSVEMGTTNTSFVNPQFAVSATA